MSSATPCVQVGDAIHSNYTQSLFFQTPCDKEMSCAIPEPVLAHEPREEIVKTCVRACVGVRTRWKCVDCCFFVFRQVGSVAAQEESKTNCHQCWADTPRMS